MKPSKLVKLGMAIRNGHGHDRGQLVIAAKARASDEHGGLGLWLGLNLGRIVAL